MSGKAYTMKEMRGIVDYLVEHKAYGEIKGRKMWMDFANSQLTSRSWQSLKETFLKRILPDIHNPYYKLSIDQVQSFRQGFDVKERDKNKLEIHAVSDDSGPNAETSKDNQQPSTSKQNGEKKTSGEDIPSRISSRNRSSIDTVILENYETADDILRVLESPNNDGDGATEDVSKFQSKSLRDLITYSEPLTPMLQEVLHDFATDDESDSGEPQMQIVEDILEPVEQGNISPQNKSDSVQQEATTDKDQVEKNDSNESDNFAEPKVKSLRLRKRQGVYVPVTDQNPSNKSDVKKSEQPNNKTNNNNSDAQVEDNSDPSVIILSENSEKIVHKLTKSQAQSTQNCSSSTTDTVLPNNQEALNKKVDDSKRDSTNKTETKINGDVSKEAAETNEKNQTTHDRLTTSDNDVSKVKADSTEPTNAIIVNSKEAVDNQNKKISATGDDSKKSSEIDTQDILPPNKTKDTNSSTQLSQGNPCLQSVSLFAEQFNLTNYLDSESSHEENPADHSKQSSDNKPLSTIEKPAKDKTNEVVILKSHSDTESDSNKEPAKRNNKNKPVLAKSKRSKALANVFGFSSGAVKSNRRKLSLQKSPSAHHYHGPNSSVDSSEWTSESDSDYVSPPRGRRGRQTRKYLKPKSARIHSLEDEGGLFVMYGNKIYPLVKDGRTIRNYLLYSPDSDPEDEENYWKQKYVEERKRVEELKKVIKQSKRNHERDPSPLLPTKSSRTQAVPAEPRSPVKSISISDDEKAVPKGEVIQKEPIVEPKNKTLKITFAKNNQEVHLEGHWSQLHPVLADVVEIFHKDADAIKEPPVKKSEQNLPVETDRAKSPVVLTPIDPEVHEKVNKLETEIFKEIEERDQEEQPETKDQLESNVTKRKRPNRISSTSTEASNAEKPSPESTRGSKRAKTIKKTEEEQDIAIKENEVEKTDAANEVTDIDKGIKTPLVKTVSSTRVTPKKTKTPKKEPKAKEPVPIVDDSKVTKTRSRKSKLAIPEEAKEVSDDGSEVRYMLPPKKKSAKSNTSVGKGSQPTKRYTINLRSLSSHSDLSQHSESTQGYHDSDGSPPKRTHKKKRKLSLSTVLCKNKSKNIRMKRRSHPIICDDRSSDSNKSYHIILKPTFDDCSLKSDEYRSESYQILMANRRNIFKPLDKIEEDSSPSNNNTDPRNSNIPSKTEVVKTKIHKNITNDNSSSSIGTNSSNLSLPLSPELSMVEKLSVSKELVHNMSNHPTLNELHSIDTSKTVARNKYLISQIDVTMPLMQQECGVYRNVEENLTLPCTHDETKNPESESFLNKINTVSMVEAPSLSESLDTRLKNLLLESAKKMSISVECNNLPVVANNEIVKKTRAKRCSTPRKKKGAPATKLAKGRKVDPVIEEECMELCSHGGRKSCPPVIHVINHDENKTNNILEEGTTKKELSTKGKPTPRKKKDIIKVKITRPSKENKSKSRTSEKTPSKAKKISRTSIPTDSKNDEESGIALQELSDGVDLIHNHSETCLHLNECIGDSVEFLEMTAKSVISVNSNSTASCDCKAQHNFDFHDCADLSFFCNNARDATTPQKVNEVVNTEPTSETIYHSPSDMSLTSLITEDLSDEHPQPSQSTKWYLLSEDETNTNVGPQQQKSFGANLQQLFPITCAVPDLSTITEMSKENDENSRKATLEGSVKYDNNTMNDVDSQSLFNMD